MLLSIRKNSRSLTRFRQKFSLLPLFIVSGVRRLLYVPILTKMGHVFCCLVSVVEIQINDNNYSVVYLLSTKSALTYAE